MGGERPAFQNLPFEWLSERKIFAFRTCCDDFRAAEPLSSSTMGGMVGRIVSKKVFMGQDVQEGGIGPPVSLFSELSESLRCGLAQARRSRIPPGKACPAM